MKCLVLDTALAACSVALTDNGQIVASHFEEMPKGHAEHLLPMIDQVLNQAGCTYQHLDRLAVTVGPGAFTGLRIGLSTARGLAVALDLPLAGITTLEALAVEAIQHSKQPQDIAVAIDARREQVYFQIFSQSLTPLTKAEALSPEEAGRRMNDHPAPLTLVGNGADLIPSITVKPTETILLPDAKSFAVHVSAADYPCTRNQPPQPVYLRAPDAKLPSRPSILDRLPI